MAIFVHGTLWEAFQTFIILMDGLSVFDGLIVDPSSLGDDLPRLWSYKTVHPNISHVWYSLMRP